MVFRFLLRYLTNNEELVRRLSESYPVRRFAQLVVAMFNHSKSIAEKEKLDNFKNLSQRYHAAKKKIFEDNSKKGS